MRRGIKWFFPFLMTLAFVNPAGAESLTLRQALDAAMKDNPGLKSYSWNVRAQKQDVRAAKSLMYPVLKIEERYQRTNNPTYGFMSKLNQERFKQEDFEIDSLNNPDAVSDFQTSFNLEQPLFAPKISGGISIASKELEAMESDYERKKDEVALKVVKAFNMVGTAREFLVAAHKGTDDAREHKRLASLRYNAGTGLYSDVLRAEVAVKRAEAAAVKAESDLEVAKRALGLVIGMNMPVDIAGEKPVLLINDLDMYLEAASERDDLNALKLRYQSSRSAVKLEKSVFIPEIGMGGSYLFNDHRSPFSPEGESYILMGFLRWNIFDASGYHRIKQAQARVHEAEEHVSGLVKEIEFRVNEAYIRVKEKEQNLSLSKAVFKEAEEALRIVRTRYENSLTTLVDLLDTQTALDGARAGLAKAENEYVNAAADLYFQSGILLKTLNQGH